ncbi:hypothetical protein EVAR_47946_1 [Eumeta japonica]|uniref:C2H2-type domain-containing protein n=1 Tax=Eumeta variegata TaxID=151549 RepID=A0A4C1XAT3_EUMVA|nr:hypothetical protein EVAR_47946_1 [Eumeta japonica]
MSTTQNYTCIFCKDSFDDKETYQIHFRQHGDPNLHNLITAKKQSHDEALRSVANNNKQKSETTEMVSCDVCTETFLTISKAITHKHKAHPDHDAKYFCPWCGKLFTMKKHMADDHSDENQCPDEVYRCPLCEAIFYHLDAYEVHLTFHSNNDNYGSTPEVITTDLAEFNLETVPPKIEKVENYEDDPENNITSIGIDQFLQLAIDTPQNTKVENDDEQSKSHKKHKKHKKSKKAITLDQFLNMNKDVFGDCLDIQGVEEVPTQVVTKQFRIKKPKAQPIPKPGIKVISTANLDKLKQQGIVVKMKGTNKGVPVLPGIQTLGTGTIMKNPVKIGNSVIASKNDNSEANHNVKTKAVLSKIINKPNSEIKIVKKPPVETINDKVKADLNTDSNNDLQDHDETHDSGRESDNETEQYKQASTDEDNIDKEKTKTNTSYESPKKDNETNDQAILSPNNSDLESKQPLKAFQKLSQEITIKPINKNTNPSKFIKKPKEENAQKLEEVKDEIIQIDHDEDEDEFDDNIENGNDQNNCTEEIPNTSHIVKPENTEKKMLVRFNKSPSYSNNSSGEEENIDSEFNSGFSNAKHEATIDKIKKLNQNISIKSMNESKNLTIKSSDSFKNLNVVQCVKTVKVENYSSNFKQLLKQNNDLDRINHLRIHTKPKTADSLKVINSFKEINFTDDDDDDEMFKTDIHGRFNTPQESEKKETASVEKIKEENNSRLLKQTLPIKKTVPMRNDSIDFESAEDYSENSNNGSDREYENDPDELYSDNNIKEKNKNVIEKLKNTNVSVKSVNEKPLAKVMKKPPKQNITVSPMVTSTMNYQNRDLRSTYDNEETDDIDDNFSNEDMQFFENESSEEEVEQPIDIQNPHQDTVNKLLSSNQALSIKATNQNNPNGKSTTIKHSNATSDEKGKSTAFINNLKTANKNLTIKSINENKPSTSHDIKHNQKGSKIVSDPSGAQNNRDSSPKPSKPIPLSCKVVNAKPQMKNTSNDVNKSNQIVHTKPSNQEIAISNQGQRLKQEVTVKTVQTKTETVVEEITTTVTKTIRTINQMQTVNQEMSSVSNAQTKNTSEGMSMIGKNIQRIQPEVRPPVKQIKNVIPQPNSKVVAQPRMIRPSINNPVKVSNQMVPLKPNMNQQRPRNPYIPYTKKIMPGPSSQQQPKPSTSKPLKISPNVIRQQPKISNKIPMSENSGAFQSVKKQKELVPSIDDLISEQDGYDVVASHMSNSQQSTSKIIKSGSVVVSSHKSQVNSSLSQQLTRLSNNSGLKIMKTNTKIANEAERTEANATKRIALDAIHKLQKQGLLVKRPRMDIDSEDMSGSGCESDDPEHHYLAEDSDD